MTDTKHDKFPSSIWVLVYNVAWDMGSWVKDKPTYNRSTEYVRADIVATKDVEIARLRGLLQWRQSAGHAGHCAKTFHKGECDCGLDAVANYFREIGE